MKLQLALLAVVLVLYCSQCSAYEGDGQPGCKSQRELDVKLFRNHWDPTAYWKCDLINEDAILERCPSQTAFMDSLKTCVSWSEWEWEVPIAPLSEAATEED